MTKTVWRCEPRSYGRRKHRQYTHKAGYYGCPTLLAPPIATPLQCGRPETPGLLFLKLLSLRTAARPHAQRRTARRNSNNPVVTVL